MTDAVRLKTKRLCLRAPTMSDAQRITELIGDKRVAWNLGRVPYPYSLSDARDWIPTAITDHERAIGYALMIDLAGDGVIGCVGLTQLEDYWEIGYWLGVPYWGHGYVTEAATALLDWAEGELGLSTFISGHFIDNPASGRVLEKLGFTAVGTVDLPSRARGFASPAMRYVRGAPAEAALRLALH